MTFIKISVASLPVYASRMLRSSNGWYWFDEISYMSSGCKTFATGPFNMKEHAIITIFAHCGVSYGGGDAYSIGAITVMKAYYKQTLRAAPRDKVICSDGKNVVPGVWKDLDKISEFSERIRSGSWVGATGKALKDVVAVGIGGSFLGPLFVHTSLQTDPEAITCAKGRQLRFLANADPIDVAKAIAGLNPKTTLGWWQKHNYVLSAALNAGTTFMGVLLFFAL
ncbi:hypothetical protein GIB67_011984 [Kingdonia uniflora]|uniref:Glucose-6-phosphate isomerase n=1 Tax=Kingdonia uniflora TaxID=39325 RepID=A0A7J7M022_9MAGN|nr:hypothetical protein GIB67_011984 [Kingdonia uniflora]